jgi:hypothetical protein
MPASPSAGPSRASPIGLHRPASSLASGGLSICKSLVTLAKTPAYGRLFEILGEKLRAMSTDGLLGATDAFGRHRRIRSFRCVRRHLRREQSRLEGSPCSTSDWNWSPDHGDARDKRSTLPRERWARQDVLDISARPVATSADELSEKRADGSNHPGGCPMLRHWNVGRRTAN